MRIPLITGNWKMNTTVNQAIKLVKDMLPALEDIREVDKVVCPPFISLFSVKEVLRGKSVKLGAQNVFFEEKGAFTGEISPHMLADICEYVIIGHSERRQYFHETSETVSLKVKAAQKASLKPIVCIGERLAEYEKGKTREVVLGQLEGSLANITDLQGLVIAYEPVWAIGTGKAATAKQAQEVIGMIRDRIEVLYGSNKAEETRVLYGGSVTQGNISELMVQPDIDGALVGGASLKADEFISIVEQSAKVGKTRL